MIKLFTLNNISSSSSEALYKICLTLDQYGLNDQNVFQLDSYDDIFAEAQISLADGDFVLIGAEPSDFLRYKYEFISKSVLSESMNEGLAAIVSNSYLNNSSIELEAHCTVPQKSTVHASSDGLYSGFSVEVLNGLCTVLPLDFGRLDSILSDYVVTFIDPSIGYQPPRINIEPEPEVAAPEPSNKNCVEAVAKMIYSLSQSDSTIAIANGEAALHIYNLYDRIQGLSDVTSFVEIIDPVDEELPEAKEEKKDEMPPVTKFNPDNDIPDFVPVIDENGEAVLDEYGNPIYAPVEKKPAEDGTPTEFEDAPSSKPEKPKESASAKTIRHAREAMRNMNSTFGAAISDIYSATDDKGQVSYFVFVAVGDGKTVKAKKIGTSNEDEAEDLLFHGISVLCETINQKIDAVRQSKQRAQREKEAAEMAEKQREEKKLNPVVIGAIAAVFIVAIISAVILATSVAKPKPETTVPTLAPSTAPVETTASTEPTTQGLPGIGDNNNAAVPGGDNNNLPAEPGATDVSANATTAATPSTSGTFTFYVFGYGHGVGLSQNGAKYYANKGWNYAQILANYFYGTTLMQGDKYPSTINYNGTDYNTREFIASVLEAEMSSSSPVEALRAQAVAIYTFAKYYNFKLDSSSMAYKPGPSQACYDVADFVEKNGLYIAYGGQTALTPFHATSAGVTTSYYNAWGGTALNYLAGGRPSYGDQEAPDYRTTVTLTSAELKSLIEGSDPSIQLSGDPSTWISVLTHDAAINENIGYVSTIRVGGKEVTGNEFRSKLMGGKLRSHCFMIKYTPDI